MESETHPPHDDLSGDDPARDDGAPDYTPDLPPEREAVAWIEQNAEQCRQSLSEEDSRRFEAFGADEWARWLDAFLDSEPCEPEVFVDTDVAHLALRRLYHLLPAGRARSAFADAVGWLFRTTAAALGHEEKLYHLIQLIDYLKPRSAQAAVEQELFSLSFRGLSHEGQDLHTALLVAYGKYSVDEDLVEFVYRSSEEVDDFEYLLAGLRVLAAGSGAPTFDYLRHFVPHLGDPARAGKLAELLRALLEKTGYRHLYLWYIASLNQASAETPTELEVLEDFLGGLVLPEWDAADLPVRENYLVLLSALLLAKRRHLQPAELLAIARRHRRLQEPHQLVLTLDRIYQRIDAWSRAVPWHFDAPDDFKDNFRKVQSSFIKVGGDSESFDSDAEPEVELIFQRVRNRYEARRSGGRAASVTN